MAYMSQEKKAKIAAELKKVMPKDWKYSLAVRRRSSIVLAISAAPVDLIAMVNSRTEYKSKDYYQVNEYYLEKQFDGQTLEIMQRIKDALNTDNFCVGHYVNIHIGHWDKPFQVLQPKAKPSYDELKARIAQLEKSA